VLEGKLAERDRQFAQMENRLALLEAEQRQMRYLLAERSEEAPAVAREPVRTGKSKQASEDEEPPEPAPVARERPSGPRPVLRLVGEKRRDTTQSYEMMPIPEVNERLPIAPVPDRAAADGSPETQYARALDLVRQREFGHALVALTDFLARYPQDLRAPRVLFWRGEVLFAQHEYTRALAAFETALARDPAGDKAPDALLKMSLCHKRLGDADRARAAIQRLKTQFPQSNAAKLAAQEDA
jgi:tol-pal system protein YbgF